jgi:transposase
MKAYSLDFRKRVIAYINEGASKAQAARLFKIGRASIYRFLVLDQQDKLAPQKSWGHWRKLDPDALRAFLEKKTDATLAELKREFNVSIATLWKCLIKMKITLKKTHKISRK